MPELRRLLEGRDLEKTRKRSNPFWLHVHDIAWRVFGDLAVVAYGVVSSGETLKANYLTAYEEDSDKEELRDYVRGQHRHVERYLDISRLSREQKGMYIRSYHELDLDRIIADGTRSCTALLGHVGCGKTSLLAYLTACPPTDVIIVHDNLAQATSEETLLADIYISLPRQLRRAVLTTGGKLGMKDRQLADELYEEELRAADALIEGTEDELEKSDKEQRRSLILNKMTEIQYSRSRDIAYFLRRCVEFLTRHGKRVCLVFDDIDRLRDRAVARSARNEAIFLSQVLNVPVLISLREETIRKGLDLYGREEPIHLCGPSFRDVLQRRLKSFGTELAGSIEPRAAEGLVLDAPTCHKIAESVAATILNKRLVFYLFRMLSNGNMQQMLDYYRALLASPNLGPRELIALSTGKEMSEHRVIEDLMLYVYEKLNAKNSFIINLYTTNAPQEGMAHNALFRIRILQTIGARGRYVEGKLGYEYSLLSQDLCAVGYVSCVGERLSSELKELQGYGLIDIPLFDGQHEIENPMIQLEDAAHLYKDFLIYRYSYIQTVIPDCWLDYSANEAALDGNLREIDVEVLKFIDFVGRCEKAEREALDEDGVQQLREISGHQSMREALRERFETETSHQRGR